MVAAHTLLCDRATEPRPFGLSLSKPGLVRWFGRCACVECGGRESPGVRVTFFCVAKRKSPKKRRPPVCDPHAVRGGKPASGRLRGAPWNSLCAGARRSDNHGESVHEAWALRRPCSPHNRPAAGAASRGGTAETSQQPHGPLLRSASWSRRAAHARSGSSEAMARLDVRWVPFCACREAQGRGCVRVPKDTRTSCTDSPQLFERSAQRAASSAVARPARASQVARSAAKGRAQQGRLLFGDFLLARQEKVTAPPGAHPGLRPPPRHVVQIKEQAPASTSSARTDGGQECPSFDQLIPNGPDKPKHYKNNSYQRLMNKR